MLQKLRSIPLEQGPNFPDFQPIDFSAFPASTFDPEPVAEKPDESLIGRIVAFALKPKPKTQRRLPRFLEHGNRPEQFGRFRP